MNLTPKISQGLIKNLNKTKRNKTGLVVGGPVMITSVLKSFVRILIPSLIKPSMEGRENLYDSSYNYYHSDYWVSMKHHQKNDL